MNTKNQKCKRKRAAGAFRVRTATIAAPIMAICALFMAAAPASAQDEGACSNRTLKGDYGFAIEGFIHPGPGVALPVRGIVMASFDGKGNLTQVDHVVLGGTPPAEDWTSGKGTYQLHGNCTGTMVIQVPSIGDLVNFRIVAVKGGKQIHAVATSPFTAVARTIATVGTRVD